MADRTVTADTVLDVLSAWSVDSVIDISLDPIGTINQTWIVTADSGRYAVRLRRGRDGDRLKRECGLIAYAVSKGIAALEPISTVSGECFEGNDSGLWTLTSFAPGFQNDRESMSSAQDRGMGRCLARLLRGLSDCPRRLAKPQSFAVDVSRTLLEFNRCEDLIRAQDNQTRDETYALDRLNGRRRWIETHPEETTSGLTDLPQQVIHGDYQEKNVFFDDNGDVVALIDWEKACLAPSEWEIIRTLDLVMQFDVERGKTFVEGYQEEAPLDLDTLDRAAWAYGVMRTHDLWLFREIYERGHDRVRRFLSPGPFRPIYDRWAPLRDKLTTLG